MRYYLKCNWCKNLTGTGHAVGVSSERDVMAAGYYMQQGEHSVYLWCCTACYQTEFRDMVEEEKRESSTENAPRHLNG